MSTHIYMQSTQQTSPPNLHPSTTRKAHYNTQCETFSSLALHIHARRSPSQVVIVSQFLPISKHISLPNTQCQLLAIAATICTSHNMTYFNCI